MSTIKIKRNEAGNCVNFEGSSNPTYWNACLSAEVDSSDNTLINVINDILTAQSGEKEYEFYKIPFTTFVNGDGNAFTNAQECADYITEKANVVGLSGEGIDLTGETVCFSLDATSTSIMLDTGHAFGVNTIKAVPNADGTVHIVSNDGADDITHFHHLDAANTCVNGGAVSGGLQDVVNTLNELFTVGAFESVVISDPYSTMVANVNGENAGYTLEGSTATDPAGDDIFTNSSSGNYAGLKSTATISRAGEYFTFDIRGEGQIGFGLVHTQESFDEGYFSGSSNYADPTSFANGNSAHYGFQFSHWFHPTPNGSWTNYGANTSYSMRPGWSNWESQNEWLAGDPVKIKVGLDENGFISISSLQDDNVTWVVHARTSYPAVQNAEFHLGIKAANSSAKVFNAPKVHLLDTAQTPTALGTDAITVFGEGIAGTLAGGISSSATDDFDNDGFVTSQTINASGEYFEFTWSAGADANFGLFSENDYDVSDLTSNTSAWGNDDYIFYGARLESNGVINGMYSDSSLPDVYIGNSNDPTVSQYYGRIGFDGQGRATIWHSTDGVTYTVYRHTQAAAPSGDYKFIWIAQEGGAIFDTLQQGVIDTAPTMNFRYAESPDGIFKSPLFSTPEEAEYYDTIKGGSGTYTTMNLPDDPTNTLWYVPDTEYTGNGIATPSGDTFEGNSINWTEITTLTNADLVPIAFSNQTVTVNELSSVNIQVHPQGASWSTDIVDTDNSGLLLNNTSFHVYGTAPEVTGDNVANPSDSYDIEIVRTNSYGSSSGILTVVVENLTAPIITPITGFTHNASSTALFSSSKMNSGSVITMNESLKDLERFIILKSYVETNILPSILATGGKYYIGVLNSGADVSSVEDADWDIAFVWEYQTPTTHKYRVIKDGVQQHSVGIGSNTTALFDYAIESHDGHAHMIACNANSINTEPSPEFGGTFTNATEVALDESHPLTISMAYVGSDDAQFGATGLSEIVTPLPDNFIQVTANPSHTLLFDGQAAIPTLQAGYTYRFMVGDTKYSDLSTSTELHIDDDLRFTADGSTEYTTGIVRVGNPNDTDTFGIHTAYVEFTIPSNVPPLQWYTDHNGIGSATGITISGSTYVTPVTGVTIEGPTANFTGNVINSGSNGWISLNEQLHAGERLVLDSAFLQDLNAALPDHCIFWIGLKDATWSDTATPTSAYEGLAAIRFYNTSSSNEPGLRVLGYANNGTSSQLYTASLNNTSAFIEVTGSGNNIRVAYTASTSYNANSTSYADWDGNLKIQTGDQGYGISAADVGIYWQAVGGNTVGFDISDVDFTELTEINIPTPQVTNTTPWTKALDFSGSNEHAKQVSTFTGTNPLSMGSNGVTVNAHNSFPNKTSNSTYSRPWATVIVFKADGNNSNQHIWNYGEGASSGHDNIYLKLDAQNQLQFNWGRVNAGSLNQMRVASGIQTNTWYGVYIAHKGARYSSSNATSSNLADAFDVRLMSSGDSFAALGNNLSTSSNWTSTGGRMDRSITGVFTVGGRGSNRNFHGKVASMIVTTLVNDRDMPTDAEIKTMITDPVKWLNDYKIGVEYRFPNNQYAQYIFQANGTNENSATQIWLMGDGTLDSYANGIRGQVQPTNQNYTKMQLNSMVSNDIENVNIQGLS